MYVYTTYTRPLSVQAQYSRSRPIISSSCYNSPNLGVQVPLFISQKNRVAQLYPQALRRILRLKGLRWRYSNPAAHGVITPAQSQSHIAIDCQSVSLGVEPHLRLMTRYLLLSDSYGLVFVGHPLRREDGSVFCICCWPLKAVFLGSESLGTRDHILLSQI
jgi:hypothetical protein